MSEFTDREREIFRAGYQSEYGQADVVNLANDDEVDAAMLASGLKPEERQTVTMAELREARDEARFKALQEAGNRGVLSGDLWKIQTRAILAAAKYKILID